MSEPELGMDPAAAAETADESPLAEHQLAIADRGRLPQETRRVLVQLLRGPYLRQSSHPNQWRILLRDEAAIRESLGNLFLDLTIDTDRSLAFVANAEYPGFDAPKVVRATALTLIDTALVLHLRQLLLHHGDAGGRTFVGRDEIDDALATYRPVTNTDASTFAKRINASVEKMKKSSVLLTSDQPDRFEISPILALIFDADQVSAVGHEVRVLVEQTQSARRAATDDPSSPAPDDPEPDDPEPNDPEPDAAENFTEDPPAGRRIATEEDA